MNPRTPHRGARKARTTTIRIGSVVVSRLFVSYLQDQALQTSGRSTPPGWCGVRPDVWRDALKAIRAKGAALGIPPHTTPDRTPLGVCTRTLAHWRRGVVRLAAHYRRRLHYALRNKVVATTLAGVAQGCALRRRGAPRRSPRVVGVGVRYIPTGGVLFVVPTPDAPAPDHTPAGVRATKAQRAALASAARREARAQRRALRVAQGAPAPAPAPAPEPLRKALQRRAPLLARVLERLCGVTPEGTPSRDARDVEALTLSAPILAHRIQGLVSRFALAPLGSDESQHLAYCMREVCAAPLSAPALARLLVDLPIVS